MFYSKDQFKKNPLLRSGEIYPLILIFHTLQWVEAQSEKKQCMCFKHEDILRKATPKMTWAALYISSVLCNPFAAEPPSAPHAELHGGVPALPRDTLGCVTPRPPKDYQTWIRGDDVLSPHPAGSFWNHPAASAGAQAASITCTADPTSPRPQSRFKGFLSHPSLLF